MNEFFLELTITILALLFGTIVLCFAGFGIAIAASPFLLLFLDSKDTVVLINTVSLGIFLLLIFQNRQNIDYKEMRLPIACGLVGVPFGLAFFEGINNALLGIVISLLIICSGLFIYCARGTAFKLSNLKLYLTSFFVGGLLTSTGVGGPLMAVAALARNWGKDRIRGSLPFFYVFVEGTASVGYLYSGRFNGELLILISFGFIPAIVGFVIASQLARKSTEKMYKKTLLIAIIAAGFVALVRQATFFLEI